MKNEVRGLIPDIRPLTSDFRLPSFMYLTRKVKLNIRVIGLLGI